MKVAAQLVLVRSLKSSRTNHKLNNKPLSYGQGLFTGIAQLVEHRSPKPRVVGSSPPSRAKKIERDVEDVYQLLQGLL